MKKPRFYNSIHNCPIWNFELINKNPGQYENLWSNPMGKSSEKLLQETIEKQQEHEEGSEKYKLLGMKLKTIEKDLQMLENAWIKLYDEFLLEFDLSDTFKEWHRLVCLAANLQTRAMTEPGQLHLLTMAKVRKQQAEEVLNRIEGVNLGERAGNIFKATGHRVNVMETTVYEFYYIEKQIFKK